MILGASAQAARDEIDIARHIQVDWVSEHYPSLTPVQQRIRAGRRRWLAIVVGIFVFGLVLPLAVIGAHHPHHRQHPAEAQGALRWVGLALLAAGLVAEGGALLWVKRAGLLRLPRHSPLRGLSLAQRRRLSRQIRRKLPHTAEETPFLLATVTISLVSARWLPWVYVGLVLTALGQAVGGNGPTRWLGLGGLALYCVGATLFVWAWRRIRGFRDGLAAEDLQA